MLGGARAEHLVRMLLPIGPTMTVFDGGELDAQQRSTLEQLGVSVHSGSVASVTTHGDGVRIAAGDVFDVDGVFVANSTARQRAPFAEQLGLRMLPTGAIEIDDFGRTSVPGVWAAGDLAHRASVGRMMPTVMRAAAAGQVAAIGIIQELAL